MLKLLFTYTKFTFAVPQTTYMMCDIFLYYYTSSRLKAAESYWRFKFWVKAVAKLNLCSYNEPSDRWGQDDPSFATPQSIFPSPKEGRAINIPQAIRPNYFCLSAQMPTVTRKLPNNRKLHNHCWLHCCIRHSKVSA